MRKVKNLNDYLCLVKILLYYQRKSNLRSGVIIIFFCFFASSFVPKADYRDKGRGHDRRLKRELQSVLNPVIMIFKVDYIRTLTIIFLISFQPYTASLVIRT